MLEAAVAEAVIMVGQQLVVAAVVGAGPVLFLVWVQQVLQIPAVVGAVAHPDSMVALAVPVSSSSSTLCKMMDVWFITKNGTY
jgi:hypothetical protein